MILVGVGILTTEIRSETDTAHITETTNQTVENYMTPIIGAKVSIVEIEAPVNTGTTGAMMVTGPEEMIGLEGETVPPETDILMIGEEERILRAEILVAAEEIVDPGALETTTANPGKDTMKEDLDQETEVPTMSGTPQGMTQDQSETTPLRDPMTDPSLHTNLGTDTGKILTTGALIGMDEMKEIGHSAETEEVQEEMTDQVTGTSHLDNPPDTPEVEGIDLEEEVDLHQGMTEIAATPEVIGTEATQGRTGTAATLEEDPDLEEEEMEEEAPAGTLNRTIGLIL